MTPANMVFGRELRLPCDLLFGAPQDKERSTTDYVADLVERLHDTHHYARRHLRVASDRMKAHYDRLANSAGFQEATESGSTARPGPEEGHQSCSRHGKARTRSSPGLTTSSTEFSGTPGREWWWYTWTDWHRTWGLLGTSSLKEGAMLHIRFPWWHDLCTLLHFHSNVTVLMHKNEFVAFL
jgi:hypothetical protein